MAISIEQAALNLAVALGLSAVIGFERQWRNRLAGLRTNTLVALGAAIIRHFRATHSGRIEPDPGGGAGRLGNWISRRWPDLPRRPERARAQYGCNAVVLRGHRRDVPGAGYPLYATVATGFVVFVNLLLRPIVSFINRQPLMSTELEIGYVVSVTCRSPDEAHIRALLLQGLAGCGLALRRLDSNDLEGSGRVAVTAFMTASHRVDADVEKIVGRLSLEPTVSAARWQAEVQIEFEIRAPPDLSEPTLVPNRQPGATGGSLS